MSARFAQFLSQPRTAWITGASSGIGRELALQLADKIALMATVAEIEEYAEASNDE